MEYDRLDTGRKGSWLVCIVRGIWQADLPSFGVRFLAREVHFLSAGKVLVGIDKLLVVLSSARRVCCCLCLKFSEPHFFPGSNSLKNGDRAEGRSCYQGGISYSSSWDSWLKVFWFKFHRSRVLCRYFCESDFLRITHRRGFLEAE